MNKCWAETPSIDLEHNTLHASRLQKSVSILPYNADDVCRLGKPLPHLMLQGNWLRDLGFEPGAKVHIDARKGHVSIMLLQQSNRASVPKSRKKKQSPVTIVEARLQLLKQRRLGSTQ